MGFITPEEAEEQEPEWEEGEKKDLDEIDHEKAVQRGSAWEPEDSFTLPEFPEGDGDGGEDVDTDRLKEVEAENERLQKKVEQRDEAIAELAEAVESLAKNQATLAGMEEHATVVLDVDAFDGIPHTVTVPPSEFENL